MWHAVFLDRSWIRPCNSDNTSSHQRIFIFTLWSHSTTCRHKQSGKVPEVHGLAWRVETSDVWPALTSQAIEAINTYLQTFSTDSEAPRSHAAGHTLDMQDCINIINIHSSQVWHELGELYIEATAAQCISSSCKCLSDSSFTSNHPIIRSLPAKLFEVYLSRFTQNFYKASPLDTSQYWFQLKNTCPRTQQHLDRLEVCKEQPFALRSWSCTILVQCAQHILKCQKKIRRMGILVPRLGMLRGQGMEGTVEVVEVVEVLSILLCRYTILTYAELLYSIGDFEASRKCGAPVLVMTMAST